MFGSAALDECSDLSCVEPVNMTLSEYEAIRSDSNQFLVVPRHVVPDVERVVRDAEGYVVVAKIGEGALLAAERDDRT